MKAVISFLAIFLILSGFSIEAKPLFSSAMIYQAKVRAPELTGGKG
jgi:hypothetical protein